MQVDEMEQQTRLFGMKWAWLFLVMAVGVWSVIEKIHTGSLPLAGMLLIVQFLVYFGVVSVERHKADDERGRSSILMAVAMTLVVVAFGLVVWFTAAR